MKKIIRTALCMICVVIGMNLLLVGCFYYSVYCKKTTRDTAISPDGTYKLTLMEIGEPVWPFGPASGRLILNEGNTQISETNFRLANDGCSISSNAWAVTWKDNHVEVILSGEEQFDEQILLYYDGTTERQSLTDKAASTETQPEIEIQASPPSDLMPEHIEKRCKEIAALYYDLYMDAEKTEPQDQWSEPTLSRSSIDAIENLLIEAGLDVVDTNGEYPSYLTTADKFCMFWDSITEGTAAQQEVITILDSGALSYRLFTYAETGAYFYSMRYDLNGNTDPYYEKHKIQEWELTDKGNFYYRIYPAGDKHYADYSLIRLAAPDMELYDLNMKYIMAGGYIATNLFLADWNEDNLGDLSFNDLWEYLYRDCYGEHWGPDGYTYNPNHYYHEIPADEFEKVVLPYFDIELDTLRAMAQYNAEGDYYPWRQVQTNDFVFLYYYMIEPVVTEYQVNSDGTITLTVEMLSTDLKTDCLFAHKVTVRPLENGRFQYVGNEVIYQTEYGLPYCEPRLSWGEPK